MWWMFEEEYPDDVDELLGAPLHHPHENGSPIMKNVHREQEKLKNHKPHARTRR